MNIFAEILPLDELSNGKVRYYSIRIGEAEETVAEQFLTEYHGVVSCKKDFEDLYSWLKRIGKRGAKDVFFRPERQMHALQPSPKVLFEAKKNKLRLYCLRLNINVVILFGGGIKTAEKAQDCPNVGPQFLLGLKLTARINELIRKGEIKFIQNGTDIDYTDMIKI